MNSGQRVRRCDVDRASDVVALDQPAHRPGEVLVVYPGDELPPVSIRAAQAKRRQSKEHAEDAVRSGLITMAETIGRMNGLFRRRYGTSVMRPALSPRTAQTMRRYDGAGHGPAGDARAVVGLSRRRRQ
jgi:hypothetical protein